MEKSETSGAQKIAALFDNGTFVELGAYIRRNDDFDGLICGYGAINGKLTYAFLQDFERQKGAFDKYGAQKVTMLYDMAIQNGAPVIGVFNSSGAVIYDGTEALSAYGKLLANVNRASGVVPQIAIVAGVCSGMTAAAVALMDFTVTVKDKASLYVVSPFLAGAEIGTADAVSANGMAAKVVASEAEANAFARELVTVLPQNNADAGCDATGDDCNRAVAIDGLSTKDLITELADNKQTVALYEGYAKEIFTGFAHIGSVLVGVVANVKEEKNGVITPNAARKAARMVSFCDSFRIPVLTLVNSTGVDKDKANEAAPYASELAKLAAAYATATTPKITIYVGCAYAAGYVLMGSKTLGADVVLALPNATFGVLSPEASVAFVEQDQLNSGKARADLEQEWTEKYACAAAAAAHGDIDDIVDPAELRQRICSAIYMTAEKGKAQLQRKHGNMPM